MQDAVAYIHSLFWIYVPPSFLLEAFCLMFQCPDLCLVCLVFIFQILTHSHTSSQPLLHFYLCGLSCILALICWFDTRPFIPRKVLRLEDSLRVVIGTFCCGSCLCVREVLLKCMACCYLTAVNQLESVY